MEAGVGASERFGTRMTARAEASVANSRAYPRLKSAGGMVGLLFRALRIAATPPYTWRREFVVEVSTAIRRSLAPAAIACFFFAIGAGMTTVGGVTEQIGSGDRWTAAQIIGYPRETGFWLVAFVFAGVVGSANTADLAARKIREELDAIQVLGIDPIRSLVVPRVLALTVAAPLLGLAGLWFIQIVNFIATPLFISNSPAAIFWDSAHAFINPGDLISFTLRLAVAGLFVAVVTSYKGLTTAAGAEGVGRAVNQAVLITFAGIWLLNNFWNYVFLTLFPDARVPVG